jgi:exodeoxyribonuclease V alpha subunit
MASYYSGIIKSISYKSDNFIIFKMSPDDAPFEVLTAKGSLGNYKASPGSWIDFEADMEDTAKWGKQLIIRSGPLFRKAQAAEAYTFEQIHSALRSADIPGYVLANIWEHLGSDMCEAMLTPSKIEVYSQGFPPELISEAWRNHLDWVKVNGLLTELGIPSTKLMPLMLHYENAESLTKGIKENPWRITKVSGLGLNMADSAARTLGLEVSASPQRVAGAIRCHLRESLVAGHLFLTPSELWSKVGKDVPDLTKEVFSQALKILMSEKDITADKLTGSVAIYDSRLFPLEDESAKLIAERLRSKEAYLKQLSRYLVDKSAATSIESAATVAIDQWSKASELLLSEQQKQGVFNALTKPVSVLTGLPGTGKTTSLKAAVSILEDAGVELLLMAPTGIAAKRLQSVTGHPATTIHRAFSGAPSNVKEQDSTYTGIENTSELDEDSIFDEAEAWEYGPGNPHPAQVVFVDESSMLDQKLLHRVLIATSPDTRLVFVGDAAQLPSVGPGNVLRELVATEPIPNTNLIEIFRQQKDNGIVAASHAIFRGGDPIAGEDFRFIPSPTDEEVQDIIVSLAMKLEEEARLDPKKSFQVLSPRHQGAIGVTALNSILREKINPASAHRKEVRVGGNVIRQGDRVMVTKNNYQLKVFNGDLGKIIGIDENFITVKIWGDPIYEVAIPRKVALKTLRLAYACTVHKSQGLEYHSIIMPMVPSLGLQLQRNLLYTAVTRAKQSAILVGSKSALTKAIANTQEASRNTLLSKRILSYVSQS